MRREKRMIFSPLFFFKLGLGGRKQTYTVFFTVYTQLSTRTCIPDGPRREKVEVCVEFYTTVKRERDRQTEDGVWVSLMLKDGDKIWGMGEI